MFLRLTLGLAALAFAPTLAHANSTTFYISNGTFQSGGTFSGSFVLDTTSDFITAGTITFNADGRNLTLSSSSNDGYTGFGVWRFDNNNSAFDLQIGSSVTAPALCYSGCAYGGYTALYLNGGTVTDIANGGTISTSPVAPTPEPSSLLLLGTGVAGVAGIARRRLFR